MRTSPGQFTLHRPAWLPSLLFAAAVTALVTWPAWPGYMSYDSLMAWRQALYGVQTMLWPPMHTYLFGLSRAAGAGVWGLYLCQAFVLFFAAALAFSLLIRNRLQAFVLSVCFALSFVYVPSMLGTMLAHWRDVPTAAFMLAAVALWLMASRSRGAVTLVLSIVSIGFAVSLRYNAVALAAPLLAGMAAQPFLGARSGVGARLLVVIAAIAALGLAWASTQWRAPDLVRLPAPDNLQGTEEFDLIGVSACADRNLAPPEITEGRPISPYQIRLAYDPRHLQATLAPKPGVPPMVETDAGGRLAEAWRRAVAAEPACYLAHRALVFTEQMGMARDGVFYPNHKRIDPNPYGLKLAHPQAAAAVNAYIDRNAPEMWRRPFLLYLAATALTLAVARLRPGSGALLWPILAGALAYPALLFFAAPAADARYIFPSNVLAAFLIVAGIGLLASRKPG